MNIMYQNNQWLSINYKTTVAQNKRLKHIASESILATNLRLIILCAIKVNYLFYGFLLHARLQLVETQETDATAGDDENVDSGTDDLGMSDMLLLKCA